MAAKSPSTLRAVSSGSESDSDPAEEPVSDDSSSENSNADSLEAVSGKVLTRLNRADPSAISRPRGLKLNPPGERKRKRCGQSTKLRKKSLHDCVAEYPGEHLVVEKGVIFCRACRTEVSQKASSLKRHVQSQRHLSGKKRLAEETKHQQSIVRSMSRFNLEVHPHGETLPEKEQVFRVEVVETFLKAGVALQKVGTFRPLLEKYGTRLADRTTLGRLIPMILAREKDAVKEALSGSDVSVIFDGSTRLGEALVIIIRYVDNDWKVRQVLARLKVLSRSLTGDQLAGELIEAISTCLQIGRPNLLAAMRDGASVNSAGIRVVKAVYPCLLDVTCFSHTIDRVGTHFDLPVLERFMQWWVQLFSRSAAAKLRWKERTGVAIKSYSPTRWWSRWEVMEQLLTHFGDVLPFLEENQDIAPRLSDHLWAVLTNEEEKKSLIMQLAAVVDAGEPFVKATYSLEGDGLLVFRAYSTLQALATAAAQRHYPNVAAQATALGATPEEVAALRAMAVNGVKPGINYFLQKFNVQFYQTVRAFRSARLACPVTVQGLNPTPDRVNDLRLFPFLDDDGVIAGLQNELPAYLAEADGVQIEHGQELQWWKARRQQLPHWSAAARRLALVQPSSAAAERVFSLLHAAFDDQQANALEDYLEAAIMLAYNHRRD